MSDVFYTIAMQVADDSCTLRRFNDLDGALNHSFSYYRLLYKKPLLRCHINHYKGNMLCNQYHYTLKLINNKITAIFDNQ